MRKILILALPIIPHLASECLETINSSKNISWPNIESKYLQKKDKIIVIQVNGKKRNVISIENDISEEDLLKKIKKMKLIDKYTEDKKIFKTIYVKDKIINIIVK